MSYIQYQVFPKSSALPTFLSEVVDVFIGREEEISSSYFNLKSNDVLTIISPDLIEMGYNVELSKKAEDKIKVPVLFGRNGTLDKYFEADGHNAQYKVVIEVEAGRGVANYQFLKDIFQACVMHDVEYLVVAVRNTYRHQKDFDIVVNFLDALYASNRLTLPLKGILVIGY